MRLYYIYEGMAKLTAVGPSVGDFVPSSELDVLLRDDDVDGSQGSSSSLPPPLQRAIARISKVTKRMRIMIG